MEQTILALAGNPNVGKSTVFNSLTGLRQHTGNWPGKTVGIASGEFTYLNQLFTLVDLPGTYSLIPHSAEEEVARDFICFGKHSGVIVVCDATCLERNLNLVLQILEATPRTLICINLMDQAQKKHISIDLTKLEKILGVPVVGISAAKGAGFCRLLDKIHALPSLPTTPIKISYAPYMERVIDILTPSISAIIGDKLPARWVALRLMEGDALALEEIERYTSTSLTHEPHLYNALEKAQAYLDSANLSLNTFRDDVVTHIVKTAEQISDNCVSSPENGYNHTDRKIDKLLTGKATGIPVMLLLLSLIFWITIVGANYPSQLLSNAFELGYQQLVSLFAWLHAPPWLSGLLLNGCYRVLGWVVAVMLPPMAIFFPMFTLLEDLGYLPRVAFNLDKGFKKCNACGKQALTMCMGFGCNAVGIVGARIIDSPRERLIAIITNNFVPCNGRFPTLIAIITMFFVSSEGGLSNTIFTALFLMMVIVLGVVMTFVVSKILSSSLLKGVPSSFTLELPPYRRPQLGKILVRSLLDRTLFVLGRAVVVAIPAGALIWVMANIDFDGVTLLAMAADILDSPARLMGLDGVILLSFILGTPANEIVFPIMIMTYLGTNQLTEMESLLSLKELLISNGWSWKTAVSTMIFTLFHWPCATACLTIKKETESRKWTLISLITPTLIGFLILLLFNYI